MQDIQKVFSDLKRKNHRFAEDLNELAEYSIADMRFINNANRTRRYDGTFKSLIEAIYQIRCNLFHGRKNPGEDKKTLNLYV